MVNQYLLQQSWKPQTTSFCCQTYILAEQNPVEITIQITRECIVLYRVADTCPVVIAPLASRITSGCMVHY